MAEIVHNLAVQGASGMIGKTLVYRQHAGKTYLSAAPQKSNKPATKEQVAVRQRFQQAVIYGKTALTNPATKEMYAAGAKEGESAFNVAVADFSKAPDITDVDVISYKGAVGNIIKIHATDDFAVKAVHVKIENADGTPVEEGDAKLDSTGLTYVYTATKANA